MTQNHVPLAVKQNAKSPEGPLMALVRLLARHAAAEAIERVGAEQSACPKLLPTDTEALNDV
jgi:hypothetical protein